MSFQKLLAEGSSAFLAALNAAQEEYAQNLREIGKLRCEVQRYTTTDLAKALKKPHSKGEGLMKCEQHGYHVYFTGDFRKVVAKQREAFVAKHARVLSSLHNDAMAQLVSEIKQAVDTIASLDVRRYIDQRQALVDEAKAAALAKKIKASAIDVELLEEFYRCYRKQAHPTPAHAHQHLNRLLASPGCVNGETLGTYQCSYCTGWHVGHRSKAGETSAGNILRASRFLRKRTPETLAFCAEKGLPLSMLN